MVYVYERALGIAASPVKAGTIKEHDTPANWIAWAKSKGYSVAHLMPADMQPQAEAVGEDGVKSVAGREVGKKKNAGYQPRHDDFSAWIRDESPNLNT